MVLIIQKEMLSCQSHLSFPHAGCHGDTSYINQSCWGVRWLLSAINNILSPSKAMTRKTNYSSIRYRFLRRLRVGPVIVTGHVLHRPRLLQPLICFWSFRFIFSSSPAYYKAVLCSMQLCDCQKNILQTTFTQSQLYAALVQRMMCLVR